MSLKLNFTGVSLVVLSKKLTFFVCVLLVFVSFLLVSCQKKPNELILATTTSTMDTGLLDVLLPVFEKKYDVHVKPIAVGTGEAISLGKRGEVDVLLVHSPEAEEEFVAEGYGLNRKAVMHNDFVIIGPRADPSKIKGLKPIEAFKKIAEAQTNFVTRGDESGTHRKELKLWQKTDIEPDGNWYIESGQGMAETIRIANEKLSYTLADRGTYLSLRKSIELIILVEKDEDLFNPYGVIAVNPGKFPKVNYEDARKFIEFLTSKEAQMIIEDFGKEKFGEPLFFPDAL
ncbi:MAG: substrate-binding domain-containing protein [Candidatus Subteraquimicrobiales bacterium]|nr:substrate-binding domain-containing protein [Candidatus Subteraquimicrobiales bacterium]